MFFSYTVEYLENNEIKKRDFSYLSEAFQFIDEIVSRGICVFSLYQIKDNDVKTIKKIIQYFNQPESKSEFLNVKDFTDLMRSKKIKYNNSNQYIIKNNTFFEIHNPKVGIYVFPSIHDLFSYLHATKMSNFIYYEYSHEQSEINKKDTYINNNFIEYQDPTNKIVLLPIPEIFEKHNNYYKQINSPNSINI